MSPQASSLARLLLSGVAAASAAATAALPPERVPSPILDSREETGVAFSPEIWAAPDPSLLSIRGRCLPTDDLYRLIVDYETDGAARYRALLVYAEPSHRLLLLQWNGAPDSAERAAIAEKPLALFAEDSQRRYATFPFRPGADDRLLVQAITPWNQRVDVLTGRVASFCDFAVENRVHD